MTPGTERIGGREFTMEPNYWDWEEEPIIPEVRRRPIKGADRTLDNREFSGELSGAPVIMRRNSDFRPFFVVGRYPYFRYCRLEF